MKKTIITILVSVLLFNYNIAIADELHGTSLYNDANLTSYYRLEGNSNDNKDSRNGTDTNITYGSAYGQYNQGISMNGSTSVVDFNSASSNFITTTAFSIVFWCKPTGTAYSAANQNIHSYGGGNITGDSNLYFWISRVNMTGGGASGDRIYLGIYGAGVVPITYTNNEWVQIVMVLDSGTLYGYKNGTEFNHVFSDPIDTLASEMRIGVISNSTTFEGSIDDVAYFQRALTANEISDLYEASAGEPEERKKANQPQFYLY